MRLRQAVCGSSLPVARSSQAPGDYLYRDQAAFGNAGGLWGLLRVQQEQGKNGKGNSR